MAWRDLPVTTPNGATPADTPQLRIMSQRSGYLNVAARRFLFRIGGGMVASPSLWRVAFQIDDNGQLSIVAHPGPDGTKVTKDGRVTVTRLTATTKGKVPVTLLLTPAVNPGNDYSRLLIAGVKP